MKYKRVVLVDPKQPKAPKQTGANEIIEPIGLCYIASFIQKRGYDVKIVQQCMKSDKEIIKEIISSKPDIVGFTAVTCVYPRAKRFAKILRKKNILTVIGGQHATGDPHNSSRDFDYVIMNEGEATFLELLNRLNKYQDTSKIKGLAYFSKKENKFILNPIRERLDFTKQPLPFRKGLNLKLYKKTFVINPIPPGIKNVASICSSKGCPYNCSFCANKMMWNQIVKSRSIKEIVDEIEMLVKKNDVNYIWFHDETLTFDKKRLTDLCREIIKRKLNIYWGCMGRVNSADLDILKLMKKAGCHYIGYGVESADHKILKKMNKQITLDVVKKAMKMTFDVGIISRAFFIIGLPYDTKESLEKMKKFAKKIYALSYRFSIFYPFLGTKDREYVDKHNLWLPGKRRLEDATALKPTIKCKVSKENLNKFIYLAMKEIYSSREYQKRKEEFLKKFPEYKEGFEKWLEYKKCIKK